MAFGSVMMPDLRAQCGQQYIVSPACMS